MTSRVIDLTAMEAHTIRAVLLEASTDGVFDSWPDLVAITDRLISDLANGPESSASPVEVDPHESTRPQRLELDKLVVEVVTRSFAHVSQTIEEWETPIRTGVNRAELDRIAALVKIEKGHS